MEQTTHTSGAVDAQSRSEESPGVAARIRRLPLLEGVLFGALAYVAGYLLVLLLARVTGGLVGTQSPFEYGGLLFFAAHFVFGTADLPTGIQTIDALADVTSTVPTVFYHAVPVVGLTVAGYLLVRRLDATEQLSPRAGARAGATIVAGYLPLVVVGTLLFTVSITLFDPFRTAEWRPDLLSAVVLAGLAYPLVFGAAGGWLAAALPGDRSAAGDDPTPASGD